jgi:DNA repair exonuclease SbcCD ATPase subunit
MHLMEPTPSTEQDQRKELECEKLRAEIATIRRPFYKTSSFYVAIAPVMLALIGFGFTYGSGWFDVQRTRVNNEKLVVQAETDRLQGERENLETQTRLQQEHLTAAATELRGLRSDRATLTNQIAQLERERDELRTAKEYFEKESQRLAGSETNRLKVLSDLQAAQADRRDAATQINSLTAQSVELTATVAHHEKYLLRYLELLGTSAKLAAADPKTKSSQDYMKFRADLSRTILDYETEKLKSSPAWQVDPDPTNSLTPQT